MRRTSGVIGDESPAQGIFKESEQICNFHEAGIYAFLTQSPYLRKPIIERPMQEDEIE